MIYIYWFIGALLLPFDFLAIMIRVLLGFFLMILLKVPMLQRSEKLLKIITIPFELISKLLTAIVVCSTTFRMFGQRNQVEITAAYLNICFSDHDVKITWPKIRRFYSKYEPPFSNLLMEVEGGHKFRLDCVDRSELKATAKSQGIIFNAKAQ